MTARRDEQGRRGWWPGSRTDTEALRYGAEPDPLSAGPPAQRGDGQSAPGVAPGLVAALKRGSRRGQAEGADASVDALVPEVTGDVVAWPVPADGTGGESLPAEPAEAEVVLFPASPGGLAELEDDDPDPDPGVDVDGAGAPEAQGVRVRGWAGRGPVGLTMSKPPKWVRWRMERYRRLPGGVRWLAGLWRAATGGELDGRPRTDATWWRWGTCAFEWSDRLPPRFAAAPRVLRALARWAGAAGTAGVVWAWTEAPTPTVWSLGGGGWVVLAASGWAAADALLGWPHRRRNVWPLHRALAPVLKYGRRTPPRRYLFVPNDYAARGGQVEVALPPDFVSDGNDERGRQVANIVRRKLRLADVTEVWRDDHQNHFLVLRPTFARPVPRWARFSAPEVRRIIEGLPPSKILLGLGPGGEPVTFDWDVESPHLFLIEGSGCGKSEDLKNIGAQVLHNGGQGLIFDHKQTSHDLWAVPLERRGLLRVFRSIEEIHRGLVALGAECEERNDAARAASKAGQPPPEFTRLAVLLDEAPTTIMLLRLWWTTHRHDLDPTDPEVVAAYGDPRWTRSPAEVAMFMALAMGRERRVHVALVSQVADAREIGGPSIRDMFYLRILGRQPRSGWRKGAPEIDNPPVCSRHRGRKYVVIEGQVIEIQATYWSDREATEWALAGHEGDSRDRALAHTFATRPEGRDRATGSRTDAPIEALEALATLKSASSDEGAGIVPYTHQTLRNKAAVDPTFPKPQKRSTKPGQPNSYDPDQLRQWHAQRTAHKHKDRP